jgi:hypothetical protein
VTAATQRSKWTTPRPWIGAIWICAGILLWALWGQDPVDAEARAAEAAAKREQRAEPWFAELDAAMARGLASVGSGNLNALALARGKAGDLFFEISSAPKDAPAWVAPCEHAAAAARQSLISAQAGNMRDAPDSHVVQAQRYLAAASACRKAIRERAKVG